MDIGQLNRTDPFEVSNQRMRQSTLVEDDGSEATFEALIEDLLSLSAKQTPSMAPSGNELDSDIPELAFYASTMLQVEANERQAKKAFVTSENTVSTTKGPSLVLDHVGTPRTIKGSESSEVVRNTAVKARASSDLMINSAIPGRHSLTMNDATVGENFTASATASRPEGVLNKGRLVSWIDAHALSRSRHHCAMYCRLGLEAAGIGTQDRPVTGDAGDYGPFLLRHGARIVSQESYIPSVGDTAVFDKTEQHPFGHIEIFDGHQWVSDFMQHGFSPYRDASTTPAFTIYRLG